MAYKFRLGSAEMSGTLGTDDIHFTDDADTGIDFSADTVALKTDDTTRLTANNNGVEVAGSLNVGDSIGGHVNLARIDSTLSSGEALGVIHFVGTEDNFGSTGEGAWIASYTTEAWTHNSAEGADLRFYTQENGGSGNPSQRMLISDDGDVGIGTSTPGERLHVVGNDARVRIDGDANSHPGLELSENGTRKWIIFNHQN